MIQSATLAFLRDLAAHNYREWFAENKDRYEAAHADMIRFAEALYGRMIEDDNLVPRSGRQTLFRIYRDVRFSQDKSPYKQHWAGSFKRATQLSVQARMGFTTFPNWSVSRKSRPWKG